MEETAQSFGRFVLKSDDEISFVIPGEEGEFNGVVVQIFDQDGAPALTAYLPGFPRGAYVTVLPEQVTAKILYSNAGLYRFDVTEKVEYYDEDARRVCMAWVYEIDSANREIVVWARDKMFSRFPEELRIVPPPRLCEEQARRDREEEKR